MATLIAYQNGDFTGATTFKSNVTGTGAENLNIVTSAPTTTSYVYSSAFTVTNGQVIEGVGIFISRVAAGTTGTFSVALSDDNGVTATREVTINVQDIPFTVPNVVFLFFKFDTTLTGDGGSDYKVGVKSNTSGVNVAHDATTSNWNRVLRSDSAVAPSANDAFCIGGDWTSAGTFTPITVTMNQTATTSYGIMRIGSKGTLSYGTSASTNYYLRLAGNLTVHGDGTLNIGTSTTRIPSTSTATLEFNCASNVQFGLEALNGSTVNIYGAEKANTKVLLTADANSGQAVITVEDTTGWAVSDEVAIASTTRTPGQSEKRTISSIGSATQATMTANLGFTHQGTSPYQGEVINLTRNVKIRGTSSTLQSYVNCAATSSFTADNAEFFFLGSATNLRRGIQAATSASGTFSMKFCALRDFTVSQSQGVTITGAGTYVIDDCVFFGGSGAHLEITTGSASSSYQRNWCIHASTGANVLARTTSAGGNFDGCRFVSGNVGISNVTGATIPFPGPEYTNVVCHSNNTLGATGGAVIYTSCSFWRNGNGLSTGGNSTVTSCSIYHNTQYNIFCNGEVRIVDSTFNGGTGQSLAVSQFQVRLNGSAVVFENCLFGQTNQATTFLIMNAASASASFINCTIAESLTPDTQSLLYGNVTTPFVGFDKLNSTSGNHRAYKRFGYAGSDQSVYRTASPSEVLVPNSASGKLPSGSKKFGVANGNDATVSVWVRKSSTYNGAEPRLILKRNIVGGVSSDQVLATLSGGTEEWLELTASTPTVTDDCVLEVYVDCSATAGTVNIDDWSIS